MMMTRPNTARRLQCALVVLGGATVAAVAAQAAAAGGGFLGMGSIQTPGPGTGLLRFVIRFVAGFVTLSNKVQMECHGLPYLVFSSTVFC